MKNVGTITLAVVACSAVAVAAQAPKGKAQPVPVAHITVVGCVQPSDPASPTHATDTKYMLTHAESRNNDSSATTGTTGSTSNSENMATYQLDAKDSTLKPDVDHQVEIVAVVEPPATTGRAARAADSAPRLKVETIRVIAATCPQ